MENELSELLLKINNAIKSNKEIDLKENRDKLLYKLCNIIKADEKLLDQVRIKYRQRGKKITVLCVTCDSEFKNIIIDNMSRKEYQESVGKDAQPEINHLNIIMLCEIDEGLILSSFISLSCLGL